MDDKKQARGVNFLDRRTGLSESMHGDCVALCNGTFESTKLLLASANADWVDGIGNDSGHVGRHLVGHPLIFAEGTKPGNPETMEQELGFITLACRHFDTPEYHRARFVLLHPER